MKRVALLGATGSIGRQALEIIGAHSGLELVAAASGSQHSDTLLLSGLAAAQRSRQVQQPT